MSTNQRVFVALWPPSPVRERLAAIAANLAALAPEGKLVAAANLHLTLAFIGALDEGRVATLAAQVHRCRIEPFVWRVDRLGAFVRARVLWAGGDRSAELEAAAANLRALLDRLDVGYDPKPFAAHVTLVRDARRAPTGPSTIDPPIEWACTCATLVHSASGADGPIYRPLTPV